MNLTLPPAASRISASPATGEPAGARETPFERIVAAANDRRDDGAGEVGLLGAQATLSQGARGFEAAGHAQRAEHDDAMGIVKNLGEGGASAATDFEWKYVNVRRFLLDLKQSLDEQIRFAVFEPNDEPLWQKAAAGISDVLMREWERGALQGARPEQAFFVKCDRSTMTQDDLDNGRLVLVVGVAPLRPAEFVIVRISTVTASADT